MPKIKDYEENSNYSVCGLVASVGCICTARQYLNRTVVVENEYNPTVMDASKINVLPRVEEPAVVKKGIEYATALRPVAAWNYEENVSYSP